MISLLRRNLIDLTYNLFKFKDSLPAEERLYLKPAFYKPTKHS
jgi:hypothetical protein